MVFNPRVYRNHLQNCGVGGNPINTVIAKLLRMEPRKKILPPNLKLPMWSQIQLELRTTNFLSYGLFSSKLENEQRVRILTWGGGWISNRKNENAAPINLPLPPINNFRPFYNCHLDMNITQNLCEQKKVFQVY